MAGTLDAVKMRMREMEEEISSLVEPVVDRDMSALDEEIQSLREKINPNAVSEMQAALQKS